MNYENTITPKTLCAIGLAMLFGALMVSNAIILERAVTTPEFSKLGSMLAGFIEEALKLGSVVLLFFTFKKRINPFVLAVVVALLFSFVENGLYIINWNDFSYTFFRIPFVLLHVFATVLTTSVILKCEKQGWNKAWYLFPLIWLLASMFHTAFNVLASYGHIWNFNGLI